MNQFRSRLMPVALVLVLLLCSGCAVIAVADAVVTVGATAVSVGATVVKTGVKATGAVIEAVIP